MPPSRWEASQRPLFVKTVWIGGARHAILTKDDPARLNDTTIITRRLKRKTGSNATVKSVVNQRQTQPKIEACFNKSIDSTAEESPTEETPRVNQFTERIYQWLEAARKLRPPTPYEGTLWETPRDDLLDINAGSLKLTNKNVELNIACTPLGRRNSNFSNESLETRPPSPGFVQTFIPPKKITVRTCSSSTRPQLHIFMPFVQAIHRTSMDSRA